MKHVIWSAALVGLVRAPLVYARPHPAGTSLDEVLRRMGEYVASYGEQASPIVAVETYTQTITSQQGTNYRPRRLVAEQVSTEFYSGTIPRSGQAPVQGQSRSVASYSGYKRFETSATLVERDRP